MRSSYRQVSPKSVFYRALGVSTPDNVRDLWQNSQQVAFKVGTAFIERRVARHFRFSSSLPPPLSFTHSLALVLFSSTLSVPFTSHHRPETPSNRLVFSTDSGYSDKSSPEISRPLGPGIIPEIRYKFIQGYTVRSPGRVAFGTALAVSRQS